MNRKVELKHGAGGEAMASFLRDIILPHVKSAELNDRNISLMALDDAGIVEGLALTTDTYTVRPVKFAGGSIGTVAVAGTINDLSVIGAKPMGISTAMLIEAGFDIQMLEEIVEDIFSTADSAGVPVITGDTKVVEAGAVDGIYINTAGIGVEHPYLESNHSVVKEYSGERKTKWLVDSNLRDGDVIICSGYIGDHGISLLSLREGYGFHTSVKSDAQPLNDMISAALRAGGVVAAKDPTRGGVANLLNEWSEKSSLGIIIDETALPIRSEVKSACELLGIDPLHIGNEGKAILAVVPEMADEVLKALRSTPEGKDAAIIGRVSAEERFVVLETEVGGRRIIEPPVGDPVPRIC